MSSFSRLIPLFKLIEDKAAAKTGRAINKYESLNNQLVQLKQYRAEYQNLDTDVPVLLTNANAFVRRIDNSIEETEQRLEARRRSVAHEKKAWSTASSRRKAVEILAKKDKNPDVDTTMDSLAYWQARCRNSDE